MNVGDVIDNKYELTRIVGQGGMGTVFEARHIQLGRRVALKFLRVELSTNNQAVTRFFREARAAAALGSEHIVEVVDIGTTQNGFPFLVMEFLQGQELAQLVLQQGIFSPERACRIIIQLCHALGSAHHQGIIHRDIKPENIIIEQRYDGTERVKVLDFGLAKFRKAMETQSVNLTATGTAMGTPFYMAPEQALGEKDLDHRVDIYSSGVVLFRLLTGAFPFDGETLTEILVKAATQKPVTPREVRPDLHVELEKVILKAIAKDKNDRFDKAESFALALTEFAQIPSQSVSAMFAALQTPQTQQTPQTLQQSAHNISGSSHISPSNASSQAYAQTGCVSSSHQSHNIQNASNQPASWHSGYGQQEVPQHYSSQHQMISSNLPHTHISQPGIQNAVQPNSQMMPSNELNHSLSPAVSSSERVIQKKKQSNLAKILIISLLGCITLCTFAATTVWYLAMKGDATAGGRTVATQRATTNPESQPLQPNVKLQTQESFVPPPSSNNADKASTPEIIQNTQRNLEKNGETASKEIPSESTNVRQEEPALSTSVPERNTNTDQHSEDRRRSSKRREVSSQSLESRPRSTSNSRSSRSTESPPATVAIPPISQAQPSLPVVTSRPAIPVVAPVVLPPAQAIRQARNNYRSRNFSGCLRALNHAPNVGDAMELRIRCNHGSGNKAAACQAAAQCSRRSWCRRYLSRHCR